MSYKHTNKHTQSRLGDWIIHCDICGMPTWHSDATKLSPQTGKGGLLVCPDDRDAIDYGLVPYEVPAEKSITETRINETVNTSTPTTLYSPFDPSLFDPMTYSPQELQQLHKMWEEMISVAWETSTVLRWDQLV